MRLYKTAPLRDVVVAGVMPEFVLADEAELDEETLREYVRNSVTTMHHPVGTASMRPLEDGGVVDSDLLVYGTSNVRVVRVFTFNLNQVLRSAGVFMSFVSCRLIVQLSH